MPDSGTISPGLYACAMIVSSQNLISVLALPLYRAVISAGIGLNLTLLGAKAFELSAGFLRIANGDDPLDASGVHPETYPIVRRILAATKTELKRLIGDTSVLRQLDPEAFTGAASKGQRVETDRYARWPRNGDDVWQYRNRRGL